ncbi:FadR/GntR family transcriptional regulator [Salininema proteolyticum]|uniref:FadR/GntR family transcriptional regulator n=1 Tax=Salininema proteolyticum TaxID=1607685 RepID=A0ABV8U3W4_9ACTN
MPTNRTTTVLHSPVVDSLGKGIANGRLCPGHVLTLEEIQDRFGVSRTVARDSMRILESMGLVRSKRRVGIMVQPPENWNVYDPKLIWWRLSGENRDAQLRTLTELRIAVEPMATSAAAIKASGDQRERLVELSREMRRLGEKGDLEEFMERDQEFHRLLLEASGNEMFAALSDVVAIVLEGRTQLGLMPEHPEPEALDLHEEVARYISRADSEGAETAMRELLSEVRAAILEH